VASVRHFSRGIVGPSSLAVGCEAMLKKTGQDDIISSLPGGTDCRVKNTAS